ncbi:hypothetical protein ISN44_As05g031570 [Arabidopsis suecica]|uniref:Uncharacterized protein n=1 Tax=Arabidopsis suecica TaxID=45249 RepID=A0A8T2DI05_ARASU|nr:hypothetical protein ISN44_As05g031570 [Arabidopsis suecica]
MKLRRKRWSWLVIETKSFKSSSPERRRRRRFLFALCDSSFLLTEETLIEDKSLSFCTCNGERWRRLFSFYKLLMILKETLDMENLLQMVHLSFLCGMEGFVLPLVCKRTLKFSKTIERLSTVSHDSSYTILEVYDHSSLFTSSLIRF